jgi:hypothetical protein
VFKTTCPECGATLKSSNPMPPGKKVKCPKCGNGFAVPEDGEPAAPAKPAAKPARAAKKPADAPGPKPPDDDEIGTYAIVQDPDLDKEDEEEEDDDDEDDDEEGGKKKKKKDKADITFALDLSVKDPRGPAAAQVVKPSNMLMLLGSIMCILCLIGLCWAVFPLIFSEPDQWLTVEEQYQKLGITFKQDTLLQPKQRSELKPDQIAILDDAESFFLWSHLGYAGGIVFVFVIWGLVVYGGVRMQNLESYRWGMASSIVALVILLLNVLSQVLNVVTYTSGSDPDSMITSLLVVLTLVFVLAMLIPINCIRTLADPKVKEGFEYEAEERRKRGGAPG